MSPPVHPSWQKRPVQVILSWRRVWYVPPIRWQAVGSEIPHSHFAQGPQAFLRFKHRALSTQVSQLQKKMHKMDRECRRERKRASSAEETLAVSHEMWTVVSACSCASLQAVSTKYPVQLENQMAAFLQSLGPAVDVTVLSSMVAAAEAGWAAAGNNVPGDAADSSPAGQLLAAVLGKTQSASMSELARQRGRLVAQALAAVATALTSAVPLAALAPVTAAAAPSAAAAQLQLQVESLKSDVASLQERVAEADDHARVAVRTLERARLDYPHVAFADSPMPLGEEAKAKAAASAAVAAAAAAAPSAAGGGGGTGDSTALAELREALEEATAEADTYKSIMQKQKETLGKLNATVKSLSDNLASHTAQPVKETDVQAHPVHVDALAQLAIVVRQRDLLKAELDQCSGDLKTVRQKMQAQGGAGGGAGGSDAAASAFAVETARLGAEVRKAKAEAATAAQREAVAQVRAQRVVELESTVTEQSKALEALQADASRWRADWKARAGTENTKVKECADVLAAKVEKLSRLVGERDGAIDALKSAERIAVRDDTVLKALQAASAGGGDGGAAADTIARLRSECNELQEKLSAARAEAVQHRSEREKVAVQCTALQAQLQSAVAEREATEEALDEVSEAYEATQAAAAEALGKLASKDSVLGGMASSLSDAKGSLVQLQAQLAALAAQLAEHKQAAVDADALQGGLREELQRCKEALSTSMTAYEGLRSDKVLEWATLPHGGGAAERLLLSANNAQRDALQGRVDDLLKQVAASGAREAAAAAFAEEAATATEAAHSKLAMLAKRGGTDSAAAAGSGLDKDSRRELRDLREMVFCPVVKTKLKSAVLKQCGHGMCKEALEQRLKDRLRRCPVCNKGFSADDVVELHLGSM